ncbi:uncharacterized protein At4g00950-like [Rutidosis leptorrhynchoides]|uniref:uncharacterized protein At4g00950-like n=1 Tax=Rutidosis leptorrhynchoides TaxID=125765 RepID=UPI003A9941FE
MGSLDHDYEPTSPKLPIFSFPICNINRSLDHHDQTSGMLTPPINRSVSIPFKWEEAPGKPRPRSTEPSNPTNYNVARCLELPPRLSKITSMPSPTTVLDGPYVGRSLSQRVSFGKMVGGSFGVLPTEGNGNRREVGFGSGRWVIKKSDKEEEKEKGSFDFSRFPVTDYVDYGRHDGDGGDGTNVKIMKMRRKASFIRFPTTKSHLMANMYKSFKQVVAPWRRKDIS